jgi:hypothetical protein
MTPLKANGSMVTSSTNHELCRHTDDVTTLKANDSYGGAAMDVRCPFSAMDSAVLGLASLGCGCCGARFGTEVCTLEDASELHAFAPPLKVLPCV